MPSARHRHSDVCSARGTVGHPAAHCREARRSRHVGCRSAQPVPHHVEERTGRARRRLQPRQLDRVSAAADTRGRPHHRHPRKVVPDRSAQSRRRLRLSRAAAGNRTVRSEYAESGLAQYGELLPRRRVRQRALGLRFGCDPAGGDVAGAVRLARVDRGRDHPHPGLRVECKRDLRQMLGDSAHAAGLRHLQSVRGIRQRGLALSPDRRRHRRNLRADRAIRAASASDRPGGA